MNSLHLTSTTGLRGRAGRGLWPCGCLLLASSLLGACGNRLPLQLGEPVDRSAAVSVAALSGRQGESSELVVVSGQVGEVCLSAGCWFVLQEVDGNGKFHELLVDLKPGADFRVTRRIAGRTALVAGRLVGRPPDQRLNAVGMVVE